MIKDYVNRAMMISILDQEQIDKLHEVEKAKGYLIPNWNIQKIFSLPEIKDRYSIPDDSEIQIGHNKRIELELERLTLRATDPYNEKMEWWHMFDWNVFHAKDQIMWDYQGKTKLTGLKSMLKSSMSFMALII